MGKDSERHLPQGLRQEMGPCAVLGVELTPFAASINTVGSGISPEEAVLAALCAYPQGEPRNDVTTVHYVVVSVTVQVLGQAVMALPPGNMPPVCNRRVGTDLQAIQFLVLL